jgi:hypothetical protein
LDPKQDFIDGGVRIIGGPFGRAWDLFEGGRNVGGALVPGGKTIAPIIPNPFPKRKVRGPQQPIAPVNVDPCKDLNIGRIQMRRGTASGLTFLAGKEFANAKQKQNLDMEAFNQVLDKNQKANSLERFEEILGTAFAAIGIRQFNILVGKEWWQAGNATFNDESPVGCVDDGDKGQDLGIGKRVFNDTAVVSAIAPRGIAIIHVAVLIGAEGELFKYQQKSAPK